MTRSRRPVARSPQRAIGIALAVLGILFVIAATLTPQPDGATASGLCIMCGELGGTDFLLNVALFVPFGVGLRLAGVPRLRALALVVATTAAVELLQLQIVSGRDASVGDVVANSLGGAAGIMLATHWRSLMLPRAAVAGRLALAGAAVVVGVLTGTVWALTTSMPRTDYVGQLAPCLEGYGRFRGTILAAELDGTPVPIGLLPGDGSDRLRSGRAQLVATVVPAAPADTLSPIVSVFDDAEREILMLAQDGRDLVFRVRRHTSEARVRTPWMRVRDVFPATPPHSSQPIRLIAGLDGRWVYAGAEVDGRQRGVALGPNPGLGWALLLPFDVSVGTRSHAGTLLWLAALLFPVGYWTAWWSRGAAARGGGERRRAAALVAGTIGLGLVAVPMMFGVPPAHWLEIAAAMAGASGGWTVGQLLLRRTLQAAPHVAVPDAAGVRR